MEDSSINVIRILYVRILWIFLIFFIAFVGSFLPFCIRRNFAYRADRAIAICTALTGSICFAVGTFLCQEGTNQLRTHWGEFAIKLGPSISIIAFLLMYYIDYLGKSLESFQPARRLFSTDRPHLVEIADSRARHLKRNLSLDHIKVSHQENLTVPLLHSTATIETKENNIQLGTGISIDLNDSYKEHPHVHHHKCELIAMGAPNLFAESFYATVSTRNNRHREVTLVNKRDKTSKTTTIKEDIDKEYENDLASDQDAKLPCDACCCDSDEDICSDYCSAKPDACHHASGLHPPSLSRAESFALVKAFRGKKEVITTAIESGLKMRHKCGGHSCRSRSNIDGTITEEGTFDHSHSMCPEHLDLIPSYSDSDVIGSNKQLGSELRSGSSAVAPYEVNRTDQIFIPQPNPSWCSTLSISWLLFLCFSFHSLVEGVGLGSTANVETIGFGIALHKGLAGFAVATSLIEAGLDNLSFFLAVVTFSLMTPIGAILGEWTSSLDSSQTLTGVFTSCAGGSFFFISLNELIPKAFKKQQDSIQKLVALLAGSILVITSEILLN